MSAPISLQRPNTKAPAATAGAPPQQAGGSMYGQPQGQYGQPGMQQPGMQQPGMGQPGMQQPAMGMGQPGMQQPGMGMQQPGMQQPGMGMQQPGMMSQPGMQQPGMGMQQPGMMSQPGMQPGMGMQQPGMMSQPGMQQPGMMSQPGMQQPGMMSQPGMNVMGNPAMGGATGGISLVKGQNMSLSKVAPNLVHARIGLGWDVRQGGGVAFDLDCSVFCVDANGRVPRPNEFIFYNNLQNSNGSIRHLGDNLTGAGEGDDESMLIDLSQVPQDIAKVIFVVSIYDADNRRQNFGMVSRAFIRILNADSSQEIVRFDLTEEACMLNTMMFGELYRYGAEWKFKALGNPIQGGLRACGQQFGLPLQ